MTERKQKTKKEETKKTSTKKTETKKNKAGEFWKLAQDQLLNLGTEILKKGVTNLAISKINDTEVEIQKVVEEKIQKHSKKIIKTFIKIFSYIVAGTFLSYGILEIILSKYNLSEYQNLFFGLTFLVVALIVNNKEK